MEKTFTKIVPLRPIDKNRSSVIDELAALDYQLGVIAKELTNIQQWDESGKDSAVNTARRALDTALQRSYRAKQVAQGLKVNKPT